MGRPEVRTAAAVGSLCAFALLANPQAALADAGGVGFWFPGAFGSLAAVPVVPGWAYTTVYLHEQENAGGGKNFVVSGRPVGTIVAGLTASADVVAEAFTYTSATPVLGGQAAFTVVAGPGNVRAGISATLTGPMGNTISGSASDNRTTLTDLIYEGTLKWNQGVNNEMVYFAGNVPSGTYDHNRLANLSLGFVAYDAGAGYTYFDQETGHEFSVVGGVTYSLMNPDLQYQNGIDFHVDWGASQFISKNVQIGLVGYYYQQLTADSGLGAKLGPFKAETVGIGPQIGFIFPISESYQGYINLKGYRDLEVENRPQGWTAWFTFAISPAPPAPSPISRKY